MTLAHDLSRRAKKARPLVVGERCYVLGPKNELIDAFITGITDSGRSYKTDEVEAKGSHLTGNRSHIRPRSPDILMIHASFLQHNSVTSGDTDGNAPSKRENSVISGPKQLAKNSSKTVLSEPKCKGSIKQSNASQVLVSETVPDRRVQPSRQAKKTRFEDNPVTSTVRIPLRRQPRHDTSTRNRTKFKLEVCDPDLLIPIKQTRVNKRHSTDLREPQLLSSDSHPASSQPVSETTTSESPVSLPSSPSGSSSRESTSTNGTDSSTSTSETSSESSSQPSSNASSPETTTSDNLSQTTSPDLLEMERSFNTILTGTREKQGHAVTRSQMDNLREQQQHITVLKQVAMQLQNQPRPVAAPPAVNVPLLPYPEDVQVTWGLGTRCRQRMPMTLPNVRTAVTQRPETDYKTFKRSLINTLGHPVSSSWPSSSHHHLMKRSKAVSTTGQDVRDSLSQKRRREGVMKRNKCCNLTLKQLDSPFRTSAMFPREIIVISLLVLL